MRDRIPNYNTISTLIDRLSIENVKLAHFENILEYDASTQCEKEELCRKIDTQEKTIAALKTELEEYLFEVFKSGSYQALFEERTFN